MSIASRAISAQRSLPVLTTLPMAVVSARLALHKLSALSAVKLFTFRQSVWAMTVSTHNASRATPAMCHLALSILMAVSAYVRTVCPNYIVPGAKESLPIRRCDWMMT